MRTAVSAKTLNRQPTPLPAATEDNGSALPQRLFPMIKASLHRTEFYEPALLPGSFLIKEKLQMRTDGLPSAPMTTLPECRMESR